MWRLRSRAVIAFLLAASCEFPWAESGGQVEPAVLVGAGDIAVCASSGDEATADLVASIPGTVFTAGDNVYTNGTATEFADCYDPSWGRHKQRTRPVPGNHDYNTTAAAGYYGYFGSLAGDASRGYYSYELGDWHIVVLNSNVDRTAGSAQDLWLRADLAGSSKTCTMAMWHHPRFSSGWHGSDPSMAPFWDALYEYGAEVVVVGHDHNYERFAPQTPTGEADAVSGVRQFVVGTGGVALRPVGTAIANSEARNDDSHGVLKFTLRAGEYDWEFLPVFGDSFTDRGSGTCH